MSNLDACIQAFQDVRKNMVTAMVRLAAVFAAKEYDGKFSSWGEFCESGLQISQSSASKLLKVHDHFILGHRVEPHLLEGIDIEKLYLGIPLLKEDTPTNVIAKVKLLSRSELREELHEESHHTHEYIEICTVCKKRKSL